MKDFSQIGQSLGSGSAIGELMKDLGEALATGGDDVLMLGGGQPAHIPEIDLIWRERMEKIMEAEGGLEAMLGNYDPPAGNPKFCEALAGLLRSEFGWDISPKNIAVTSGGQTAFFFLFNLLAGEGKKILLPLVPEYVGYSSQLAGGADFVGVRPRIEITGDHEFKYRVDFDNLEIDDDVAAICVSRPTNPTGNVLTDGEIERLRKLADEAGIPLIVDNAYGAPFPQAIFSAVQPVWDENMILTLSLSKLGLPGTRTGIVVARPEIVEAIESMTASVGLANGNVGQAIVTPLIESGEILRMSQDIIRPFYQKKSQQAQQWVRESFSDETSYYIHRSEGALFLWLWFEGLPITVRELYARLKARGVLIVPGDAFFFGVDDSAWKHPDECIRMTFTMSESVVKRGIEMIAEEVEKAFEDA